MWISMAHATADVAAGVPEAPGAMKALFYVLLVAIFIGLFYVLFILPQQKRFKYHRSMLDGLKKGDKVLTMAGFIATIEKIEDGNDEVVLKLDDKVTVTAVRSAIQSRVTEQPKAANDSAAAVSKSKAKAKKDEDTKTVQKKKK